MSCRAAGTEEKACIRVAVLPFDQLAQVDHPFSGHHHFAARGQQQLNQLHTGGLQLLPQWLPGDLRTDSHHDIALDEGGGLHSLQRKPGASVIRGNVRCSDHGRCGRDCLAISRAGFRTAPALFDDRCLLQRVPESAANG